MERLVDAPENPRDAALLVQLEQESASITAALARTDRALEAVGCELHAEQATAATAARLDLIEDAAALAVAATAEVQRRYTAAALRPATAPDLLDAWRNGGTLPPAEAG